MKPPVILHSIALAAIFLTTLTTNGRAADEYQTLVDESYVAYRAALFKTNANDKAGTLDALATSKSSWSKVVATYRNSPPAAYMNDKEFAPSLDRISSIYDRANIETSDGKLAQAHETLEGVRDILGDMRRRNGLVAFSDHINNYHSEMEFVISGELPADEIRGLTEHAGVLVYLDKQIRGNAPKKYLDDPNFQKLAGENTAAIERLRKALESRNSAEIKNALSGLKPAYAKLFLAFG